MPHVDAKPPNPPPPQPVPAGPKQTVTPLTTANAAPVKPSSAIAAPVSSPKSNVTAATGTSASKVVAKPLQPVALGSSNSAVAKPNATVTPKTGTASTVTPVKIEPKPVKVEETKSNDIKIETKPIKVEKVEKTEVVKTEALKTVVKAEKSDDTLKSEKSSAVQSSVVAKIPQNKPTESKNKPNATIPIPESSAKQIASKVKETKERAEPVTKVMAAVKTPKVVPSTSIPSSVDVKVKRNRFKTVHYQSPTPEFELVSKISANEAINAHKKKAKGDDDKLTLFYK